MVDSLRWETIANFETYLIGGGWYEFIFSKDNKIYLCVFGISASTEYFLNVPNPHIELLLLYFSASSS